MKVSINWLKDYIDCELGPYDLAERLTLAGLEVETVAEIGPALDGIVVARVLDIEPHPQADKLSVCRVNDGKRDMRIVCGAKNVRAGQMVPLARVGVKLPAGIRIRPVKLRGIVSHGMICSERELGLGEDARGIMVLPSDCTPGDGILGALRLHDYILDINVTPNRPDCLSVIGVAREVAALTGKRCKLPRFRLNEGGKTTASEVKVKIENKDLCARYSARLIKNVRIGPSPFWMRNRLGMVGFRAVNNIVDITNYVLMEYGQPLHAFDFGALRDNIIVVRTARAGEKIVTIDGKERILEGGMLVIADGERPIAIAGIMGGIESEVSEGTANVLLESAYFKPQSVKRTSGKLHLCSGSSYRFERGVDYAGIVRASDRAAYFMKLFAGGTVCRGVIDRTPGALKSGEVVLRMPRLNSVLHTRVSSPGAKRFLKSLNMEVRDKGKGKLEVKAPSYRVDIKREADLIEEVARLYGYDRIEEVAPRGIVALVDGNGRLRGREILRDVLCALGFSEAICLSFMGLSEMDSLMWGPRNRLRNAVVLRNPVSEEFSCLRTSMVPPLMRCLALNAQKGNHDVRLFEFGNVFIASDVGMPPKEEERLALVATGHVGNAGWHSSPIEPDFFYMKGVVQEILKGTGASLVFEKKLFDGFHPGRSAELLLNGERCGYIGQIHPRVASSYGVRSVVTFLELNPKPLFTLVTSPKRYERLPRFPAVKRDIAVVVEEGLAAQKIIDCVYTALEGIADSVVIFDLYKGEQIPEDKKGIALSVKMRSQKGTLKESDITEALKKVHDALRRLGCEIREY